MKRSEMIQLMAYVYGNLHRGGWSEATEEDRMNEVLHEMEREGMLAPYRDRTNKERELVDAYDQYNYIHNWEPENET